MTEKEKQRLSQILRDAGLKTTPTRLAILKLTQDEHGPHSTDSLEALLKSFGKGLKSDYTTVYRCLVKMTEAGLLTEIDLGDGVRRFEYTSHDGHTGHHHHVICRECRKVRPLEHCELTSLEETVSRMGYSDLGHRLEFFGTCSDCSKKAG